jgi:lipoprotein-releasing system permease protein
VYRKFAWKYFRAKKSANAINIIAWVTVSVIAFATCCQLLVLSVFNGLEGLVKSLYGDFYTDIKITPSSGKTFFLSPEKIAELKQQPLVANISLVAEEKALLQNPETASQTVVTIKGVDDNYVNVSGVPLHIGKKPFNTGTLEQPGLIVGSGVKSKADITLNDALPSDSLVIILPKKNVDNNDPLQSISEGNIKTTASFTLQQEFDDNYVFSNLDFVKQQLALDTNEYSAVEIKVKQAAKMAEARSKLQQLLGNNFIVQTRYQQNTSLYNTMKTEKWAIFAVLTLILIVAAFNIISALTMLVLEKEKDISVLQSMGASRPAIRKIFLAEGLLIGVVGTITGLLLATIICVLQMKYKFIPLSGGSFLINYFPVKMIALDYVLVAGVTLLISLIAAWFPAMKASSQSVQLR